MLFRLREFTTITNPNKYTEATEIQAANISSHHLPHRYPTPPPPFPLSPVPLLPLIPFPPTPHRNPTPSPIPPQPHNPPLHPLPLLNPPQQPHSNPLPSPPQLLFLPRLPNPQQSLARFLLLIAPYVFSRAGNRDGKRCREGGEPELVFARPDREVEVGGGF